MITYSAEKMNLLDYKQAEYAYFVRTTDSEEQVKAVFDNPALIKIKEVTGETAFVTAKMKEETYLEKAKQLSGIKQMIRVDQEAVFVKYIVVLGDGMADQPIPELGDKTPLEYAKTPMMDSLAQLGEIGMVHTIPGWNETGK